MGATLVLIGLVLVIVYGSRWRRVAFLVKLPDVERNETWTFNVRDMNATRARTATSRHVARYELRRAGATWERAERSEIDSSLADWTACDPATSSALEETYLRYTAEEPVAAPSGGPYRGG